MRLTLGLLLLLLAAVPASAQSRFLTACMASGERDASLSVDAVASICGCTETQSLASTLTSADLDRYVAYLHSQGETASLGIDDDAPEDITAVSGVLIESMMTCLGGEIAMAKAESPSPRATVAPTQAVHVPAAVEAAGKTLMEEGQTSLAPAPVVVAAPGLRTGDGTGAVRAEQSGRGAAVRIRG